MAVARRITAEQQGGCVRGAHHRIRSEAKQTIHRVGAINSRIEVPSAGLEVMRRNVTESMNGHSQKESTLYGQLGLKEL